MAEGHDRSTDNKAKRPCAGPKAPDECQTVIFSDGNRRQRKTKGKGKGPKKRRTRTADEGKRTVTKKIAVIKKERDSIQHNLTIG